jgi:hypothetical protein
LPTLDPWPLVVLIVLFTLLLIIIIFWGRPILILIALTYES